jgi:hypothetical protein
MNRRTDNTMTKGKMTYNDLQNTKQKTKDWGARTPNNNEVSINSTTNWNKSQSNCKTSNSKENNATDICELNRDATVKTGIWTNIFRVEISSHVDHGNTLYNNIRIYLFILQSLNLQTYYPNKV